MSEEHYELKEFINEKFNAHEDLEALRFKRIDELLTHFGKEVESNEETIKRIHTRVDRIETRIKTVQGMGTVIATGLGTGSTQVPIETISFHAKEANERKPLPLSEAARQLLQNPPSIEKETSKEEFKKKDEDYLDIPSFVRTQLD